MSAAVSIVTVQAFHVLLIAAIAWVMPALTRPDLYFAVTVAPAFRSAPEGIAILRRYRREVAVHAVIGGALLAGCALAARPLAAYVGVVWLGAGWFAAFFRARGRVRPHAAPPTTVREAATRPRAANLPGGWALQLGPFAALAATAVYLHSRWQDLPARFPIHWGLDGRPNGWAVRSAAGVYGPLWIGALVAGAMGLLAWLLSRGTRPVRAGGVAGAAERRFSRAVLAVLVGVEYLIGLTFAGVALLPLRAAGGEAGPPGVAIHLGVSLIFAAAVTIFLLRMGQGGTHLAGDAGSEAAGGAPVGDRSPDRCWKAGIFYVNPDDPALFVEKRFGIGYTLNFAHPAAWLLMILLTLVLPAVIFWIAAAGS